MPGPCMKLSMPPTKGTDETIDQLSCGELLVIQKRKGYRFSLDAYLLAAFVDEDSAVRMLEVGSGSGVIAMMLAGIKKYSVTGVELQAEMADLFERSVEINNLGDRVEVVHQDFMEYEGRGFDVVVSNPPYRPLATGRLNADAVKAVARHEISLDLEGLLERSAAKLNQGGRIYLVYPVWRLADLMHELRRNALEPKRLRMVHSDAESSAELCLVCAVRNGGRDITVEKPLFVYDEKGRYTEEMLAVFGQLEMTKSH